MKTIKVKHSQYTVVVREAIALDGMRRSIMMVDARENPVETDDEAMRLTRITAFPNCMCCSELVSGFPDPFTVDDYAKLPDALTDKWINAIAKLNPHFYGIDPEANAKKALKPDGGSGELSNGNKSEK